MIYTVKDVARILQIPESTVYEYVRNHVIPSFTNGHPTQWRPMSLKVSRKFSQAQSLGFS